MTPKDSSKATRLTALRRFATTITILNVVGHIYLGFEQSWAQPLVALATTYSMELLLELIDARTNRRPLAFAGGMRNLVDFLLPAHITGLSIAMLLWANDQLWPFVFAAAVATGSKAILRVPIGKGTRHFLNPSNLGITMTLILLPWVGFAPPYEFTENLTGVGYWILPGLIIVLGTMVNRLTGRLPLIAAWVGGFVLQACLRSALFGLPVVAALLPMTGVMFVIYTFYIITDPGTTPDTAARTNLMFYERAFWLFSTGHRLGDMRRLLRQYEHPDSIVYPTGAWFKGGPYGDAIQMVLPVEELNNTNFHGCADRKP